MKDSLTHLPSIKQQELKAIVANISSHREVELVILFGSYARGNWVDHRYDEGGITYHYQSDYDLLVIAKPRNIHKQRRLEIDLEESIDKLSNIHTPVSIIIHDVDYINEQLDEAQYFFSDLKKEGVLLYNTGNVSLKESEKTLSPQQRYKLAQEYYEEWFSTAKEFETGFEDAFQRSNYKFAAFLLHQTTERFYNAILLVFTNYKPKTHDLTDLRKLTNALDPRFIKVFPLAAPEEKRLFKLLRDAYIDARYKKSYSITKEELLWLGERVKILRALTETLCQEKMQSFLN